MTTALKDEIQVKKCEPIGTKLKLLRKKNRLRVEDVAEFIGVAPSTVVGYEFNRREPKLDTVNKLAVLYNISTDYLLGLTNNPEPKDPPSDILEFLMKENLSVGDVKVTSGEIRQKLIDQYKMMMFYYTNDKKSG